MNVRHKKKKIFGKEFAGIKRNTFLINPDGKIFKKYEGVNPATHIGDILKDLKSI